MEWLIKSAEQGDADAQYWVGIHYEIGICVDKDSKKAREWLLKAAENGSIDALNTLAHIDKHTVV